MGRTMGHNRKGENRGNVDRPEPRNAKIRRGKNPPPRSRNKGRKSSGGKVIPLRGQRRAVDAKSRHQGASRVLGRPRSREYGGTQEAVDGGGGVRGDGTSPRWEGRAHKPHGGREL